MPQRRWISRSTLAVAGVSAAVALTACGSTPTPAPAGTSSTSAAAAPTSTTGTAAAPGAPQISDAAATHLCDMIRPELTHWKTLGPGTGRFGLNGIVHEWALRNGAINGYVLGDKAVIDRITAKACPEVRTEAIRLLDLPDLASGLAF